MLWCSMKERSHGALGESARPKVSPCLVSAFTGTRTQVFSERKAALTGQCFKEAGEKVGVCRLWGDL